MGPLIVGEIYNATSSFNIAFSPLLVMCLVSYPLLYLYVLFLFFCSFFPRVSRVLSSSVLIRFPRFFFGLHALFVYACFFLFFSSIYCLNCFFLDLSFSPLSFVRSFRHKPHRFLRKEKKQKRANIVCMCVRVRVHVHVRVCQCACVPPLFQCASVVLHTHTHTHTHKSEWIVKRA